MWQAWHWRGVGTQDCQGAEGEVPQELVSLPLSKWPREPKARGSVPSHASQSVELGTRPRSAETEVEEDQREVGKASRHAWGKMPRPPNLLEPQCGRVGSWDLICPEDGDATGSVCFRERGHLKRRGCEELEERNQLDQPRSTRRKVLDLGPGKGLSPGHQLVGTTSVQWSLTRGQRGPAVTWTLRRQGCSDGTVHRELWIGAG
ncbi:unnamed protein product [Rangifer tarandus platyrhynchus]|uniref:Uncharacterized protein n=1 Tax=Rangifer tarandus platyrhynchus TaxID=3082113 RepID=A0ABN8Z5Z6_RANTA|nr:unnamed protein product [Rangifer tarandus platyrhynchus]